MARELKARRGVRVLVTGGTGVVGVAAVRALLAREHSLRLLSRHADEDARRWGDRVEACPGSVAEPAAVSDAARACDAVLHLAGIVAEDPPEATFDKVNVAGTSNVVAAATAAGVERLVYVSSLGCDRGASRYHASKRAAERIVRESGLTWTILRPGNVYGTGDEVVSRLVRMLRTLPAMPLVERGDQPFQPISADDLGLAIALTLERPDLAGEVLELAGPEVTTMQDLLDRLVRLTGRDPLRLPVPAALAGAAARLTSSFGLPVPVAEDTLVMLAEENVLAAEADNALTAVFGVAPTPLDDGLRELLDSLPPQLPESTDPGLVRRRWRSAPWPSTAGAAEHLADLRERFLEVLPEGSMRPAEAPPPRLEPGATLILDLPVRGHVPVRVAAVRASEIVMLTLAGHFLAGTVTLRYRDIAAGEVFFEVETCDQPASLLDAAAMALGGVLIKDAAWQQVVERAAVLAGGPAGLAIEVDEEELRGAAAEKAREEMAELAAAHERACEPDREAALRARFAACAA